MFIRDVYVYRDFLQHINPNGTVPIFTQCQAPGWHASSHSVLPKPGWGSYHHYHCLTSAETELWEGSVSCQSSSVGRFTRQCCSRAHAFCLLHYTVTMLWCNTGSWANPLWNVSTLAQRALKHLHFFVIPPSQHNAGSGQVAKLGLKPLNAAEHASRYCKVSFRFGNEVYWHLSENLFPWSEMFLSCSSF